MSSAYMMTI